MSDYRFVSELEDLPPSFWAENTKGYACMHDTEPFTGPIFSFPVRRETTGIWHVRGVFCSLECAKSYILDHCQDPMIFTLFSLMCRLVYGYTYEVTPAPPQQVLWKFFPWKESMTLLEFRAAGKKQHMISLVIPPLFPFQFEAAYFCREDKTKKQDQEHNIQDENLKLIKHFKHSTVNRVIEEGTNTKKRSKMENNAPAPKRRCVSTLSTSSSSSASLSATVTPPVTPSVTPSVAPPITPTVTSPVTPPVMVHDTERGIEQYIDRDSSFPSRKLTSLNAFFPVDGNRGVHPISVHGHEHGTVKAEVETPNGKQEKEE